MLAPIGKADNIVAPIINADCRADIFFEMQASEKVGINQMRIVFETKNIGLLYYPVANLFAIPAIETVE